jgi:hypothetical protein
VPGPIVRKYGFPNFEQIFGKRELQHGVADESASNAMPSVDPGPPPSSAPGAEKATKSESGSSGKSVDA